VAPMSGNVISKTAGDTNSIVMEQLYEMAHGVSNGNVMGTSRDP